ARLMLDQVLEPSLGVELIAELHRAMPRHVDSCEHRMHSRQPADVAAERAVEREDEGGRGKRMHLGAGGIAGIAPQRIIVADAVRPMADIVARGVVAPRLERVLNRYADELTQLSETLVGD